MLANRTDTNGAMNQKYSEFNPAIPASHDAHVEAAEQSTHRIHVTAQANCVIDRVVSPTGETTTPISGSVTVSVSVKNHNSGDATYFVDVFCR